MKKKKKKKKSVNFSQKSTPPYFRFYPSKLTDKIFPKWCNVKFSLLFYIVSCSESWHNIASYGDFFYYLTCQDEIQNLEGNILKTKFFTI